MELLYQSKLLQRQQVSFSELEDRSQPKPSQHDATASLTGSGQQLLRKKSSYNIREASPTHGMSGSLAKARVVIHVTIGGARTPHLDGHGLQSRTAGPKGFLGPLNLAFEVADLRGPGGISIGRKQRAVVEG